MLPLAGGTMSGAIAMGTSKITGVGDPTNAQDVVTKNYLDTVVLAPSNLTGPITSTGAATAIASQTGTGTKFVMDTSPTLVTPALGVATATSINSTTIPTSKTLVATDSTQYVVPSQTGNNGKYLTTDGTTSSWGTVAGYSAPTLGSTSITSGATVTNVAGLTINSTTIPTSKTLVVTTDKLSVHAATTSAELAGVISDETGSGSLVFGTSPTLTTPNIGVATGTSFNSITALSSTTPIANGTAAVGTGTTTARGDHVHPTTGLGLTASGLNQFAATTSAQLAGVISDETGSGVLVFGTSPTIATATVNNPILKSPEERCTVSATAATGTVAFDTQTQGVLYYTTNASANFTLNFTNVNANLAVGDSISCVFLNTNGGTAYYPTAFQVDSVGVTPKWSGGTAPAAGNASAIDAYSFTIIKTAATPTYTVLAGGAVKFA
jgi:hypothetical protein